MWSPACASNRRASIILDRSECIENIADARNSDSLILSNFDKRQVQDAIGPAGKGDCKIWCAMVGRANMTQCRQIEYSVLSMLAMRNNIV